MALKNYCTSIIAISGVLPTKYEGKGTGNVTLTDHTTGSDGNDSDGGYSIAVVRPVIPSPICHLDVSSLAALAT